MVSSGTSSSCKEFSLQNVSGGYFHRNVISILVLDTPVALFTVLTNIVFLLTIIKTTVLHSPANTVVAALFACDLFVGLFGQTLYLTILFQFETNQTPNALLEKAFETVFLLCSGFSCFVVALLSLDRYFAVCHPYKYRQHATNKMYILILVAGSVIWATCAFLLLLIPDPFRYFQLAFFILIILVLAIVLGCYYYIYRVIRRQRQTIPVIGTLSGSESSSAVGTVKREKERSCIMALIIGVFLLLHLPYLGFTLYSIAWDTSFCSDTIFVMYFWDEFFLLLSSFTNPILYGLKRRDFRAAALRLVNL